MSLHGENLEDMKCFIYLGVNMAANEPWKQKSHRVGEGAKVLGALSNVWRDYLGRQKWVCLKVKQF